MIFVTKPFLPNIADYNRLVTGIWERQYLTNNGPLVQELEGALKILFDAENVLFTSNGTISIQIALKSLNLSGSEIITTPFSYVATTSGIVWENCTPVFADISPTTFNIDPESIRKKITPKTKAILATHVFGNPCDIDAIDTIAKEHDLLVIYDAAHCFGTSYKNKSVMSYGDVSSISFHATKLFHTTEGGALICKSETLAADFSLKRNFGHAGFDRFDGVGINGKNSEFHAAMGLCNLPHVEAIIHDRQQTHLYYDKYLSGLPIRKQEIQAQTTRYNCAYYPLLFESQQTLLHIKKALEEQNIFTRRYFYPSLNSLNYVTEQSCPVSESVSERILCLPIYFDIGEATVQRICEIIHSNMYVEKN
ncbi:DegT/DnrJ/EryC1/StrS family aminotransferase [Fluviicola chungangensis]|uniref:DegT/DnrJ/EryC1/StrS family aminotransferase n=1 Tax=Fluviicola chungangensis TaxID=2597671 RepID=A0A556MIZ0_9FLAO|nr:DegT/DnrJ/EryC1/StrS family aminotransferase [Fluviicola chungangensis]TSJ39880.1 DegT/DnrJ/EryC1/StrS family aminotransferase [Fluviicola chungangensis]